MSDVSEPKTNAKIRVGSIGAGWWAATNHFPLLAARDDVEMTGVCTVGADRLAFVQREFGFRHGTEDYTELLALDLDAVIVASPHHMHYEHAAAALRRGLVVLCEKPMTLSAEQAWDLVSLSRANDAELLVAYGWNYKPFLEAAAELMEEPGVGQIEFVQCTMASPTKDFFSTPAAPVPAQWASQVTHTDPNTWQDPNHGGGYNHGQLTHAVGLLSWLCGMRATEVTAHTSGPGAKVDLYNAALVHFTNGAHGVLSGAGTLPEKSKFQLDLRVFGSDGVLLVDVERERVELRRHDGTTIQIEITPDEGAYSCEGPVDRFLALAARRASKSNSSAVVGARTVEILAALAASAADPQHRPVPINLSLGE
jgi:predicted dehydrogenase